LKKIGGRDCDQHQLSNNRSRMIQSGLPARDRSEVKLLPLLDSREKSQIASRHGYLFPGYLEPK
jgi:hypothetical protein